jgi:hypothetical protein
MTRETSIALRVGVPVVAAGLLLVAGYLLSPRSHTPPPAKDPEIVCRLPIAEPPKPTPSDDTYVDLAACLENWNANRQVGMRAVSVDDVRYWVEVEHDPVWLEGGSWWLPMSGEGEANYPSGLYISVPQHGTVCGGAIVN